MRFRATLSNPVCLIKVLETLEKLGQTCVLHLTPTNVHFYVTHHFGTPVQAFVDLQVESVFDEYKIESKSNNEIGLLVSIQNLSRAIKSGERAMRIVIKLTKKNGRAFLTFEISETVGITQEVPVMLQSLKSLAEYAEPHMPEPEVQLSMPNLTSLKSVIERMKSVSDQVTIEASSTGRLQFCVETEMVTIRTHYKDLCLKTGQDDGAEEEEVREAHATLSIKKLHKALCIRHLPAAYIVACLVEDHAVVLYTKLQADCGCVTFYIPTLDDS